MPKLLVQAIVMVAMSIFVPEIASASRLADVEASLRELRSRLEDKTVSHVDIFHMRYSVRTGVSVTPEMLEAAAGFRFSTSLTDVSRTELVEVIKTTTVELEDHPPDLRWGAVFYDESDNRLHTIYVDRKYILELGRKGVIDGVPVKLNGRLLEWFERNFLEHFEREQQELQKRQ